MKDTIWLGSDHGGYEMKQAIIEYLKEHNIPYNDVGSYSAEIVRYPYFAAEVAGAVSRNDAKKGILVCSSGIGMSILANKFKGVRASLCTSTLMGKMTRAHNDSNVLCLGGKFIGVFEAIDILDVWINTEFEGGRHNISLDLIQQAENIMCSYNKEDFDKTFTKNAEHPANI